MINRRFHCILHILSPCAAPLSLLCVCDLLRELGRRDIGKRWHVKETQLTDAHIHTHCTVVLLQMESSGEKSIRNSRRVEKNWIFSPKFRFISQFPLSIFSLCVSRSKLFCFDLFHLFCVCLWWRKSYPTSTSTLPPPQPWWGLSWN